MKTLFLWVCWALVVSASVYYTTAGLDASYPGQKAFGNVTDVELLGLALCLGQYACIHTGMQMFGKKGARYVITAVASLAVALVLTCSNVLFAYVGLSQKSNAAEIVAVSATGQVDDLRARISDLRNSRDALLKTVTDIPANHSTNRTKQQANIQPELNRISAQLETVSNQLDSQLKGGVDVQEKADGAKRVNEAFAWAGTSPSRAIAFILAFTLDPLAVILMMCLSLRMEERKEAKEKEAPAEPRKTILRSASLRPSPRLVEPLLDNSPRAEYNEGEDTIGEHVVDFKRRN